AALLAGCAGGPPVTETPPPDAGRATPASSEPVAAAPLPPNTPQDVRWPLKTREHVDLWLHGYGMLQNDTSLVPFFRRGYREEMLRRRGEARVTTMLDANMDTLRVQLAARPALIGGQFVPLYFADWASLQAAVRAFVETNGDPRRASSPVLAQQVAFLAQSFATAADRDWLRLFALSLEDERARFYDAYWKAEEQTRLPIFTAVDSLWQRVYRPKLQGFLNNSRQPNGDLMLSLPLDGEGRTVSGGATESVVAVRYPASRDSAAEAIYVAVHEFVGATAAQVLADHTSPADKRAGLDQQLQSAAAVRGGLMLLQRAAPDLAAGYATYYVRATGREPGADPLATLAATFALPDAVRDGLAQQIANILGGI
ncbi:MAG TPA: hypothetical protein VF048_06705, partial [Gemmatimonadaceae bacterium]